MMAIQSENLAQEWANDFYAPELWRGLQQIKTDPQAGIACLEKLAEMGSALAMMYLGHALLSGQFGVEKDIAAGESWLRRSAKGGSIEGGYRLANRLLAIDQVQEGIELFADLSARGYGPASFVLGLEHYRGHYIKKDIPKALDYFSTGDHQRHLHAKRWKVFILMKSDLSIFSRIRWLFVIFSIVMRALYLRIRRPGSDRLRIWA